MFRARSGHGGARLAWRATVTVQVRVMITRVECTPGDAGSCLGTAVYSLADESSVVRDRVKVGYRAEAEVQNRGRGRGRGRG